MGGRLLRCATYTLAVVPVTACSDGAAPGSTRTDDDGVRTVVSSDAPRVFAEVGTEPTVSIGGADAVGPAQLFGVVGVHVDGAGRIWVADAQSAELRIFDPDGSHWKTRGGRGEGPTEFTNIQLLGAIAGDSVMTSNGADGRVTLFDPEGELAYTERISGDGGLTPFFQDVFEDGALLGRVPRILQAAEIAPGYVLMDSVELVHVDRATSSVRSAAAAGGPLWIWSGQTQAPIPFTVRAAFDVVGSDVHIASGPEFRVQVFRDGVLRETYGVDRPPRPVRASDIDAYRAFVEAYVPESLRADHLAAVEHDLRPDVLPAYDRLLAAADGRVWAQIYEADPLAAHSWDVFDPARELAGQVDLPGGFNLWSVERDAVVGVWLDSLGVEHVRSYPLLRR